MARIKMLFLAHGFDITTIPAPQELATTFRARVLIPLREVPGWWYGYFTTLLK
jgi:hypothetical protein